MSSPSKHEKLDIEGIYFNMMQSIQQTYSQNCTNWRKPECISSEVMHETNMSTPFTLLKHVLIHSHGNKERERN
jgi:hypothetical protein